MITETWHRLEGNFAHDRDVISWLESDAMKGRWCIPSNGVKHGLYFEFEEDRMHFWMLR